MVFTFLTSLALIWTSHLCTPKTRVLVCSAALCLGVVIVPVMNATLVLATPTKHHHSGHHSGHSPATANGTGTSLLNESQVRVLCS